MAWKSVAHLQWHGFIGFSLHPGLLAAPIPIPVPRLPHISFSVINGVFLGALPANIKGNMVTGSGGIPLMGRTNDAGFIVPHVSIPPTNWLLPLTILLGGSDSLSGSSQVQITCWKGPLQRIGANTISEQFDTAACVFPDVPISLNFGCFEPFLMPLDFVIAPNSVMVGMTVADLGNMAIDFGLAVATELIMMGGGAAVSKGLKKVRKLKATEAAKAAVKRASKSAKEVHEKALKKIKPKDLLAEAMAKRRRQIAGEGTEDLSKVLREGLAKQRKKARGVKPPRPTSTKEAKEIGDAAFLRAIRKEVGDPAAVRRAMLDWHAKVTVHFAGKPKWLRNMVEKSFWELMFKKSGGGQVAFNAIDNRIRPLLRRVGKESVVTLIKKLGKDKTTKELEEGRRDQGKKAAPASAPGLTPTEQQELETNPEIICGYAIMTQAGLAAPAA